MASNQPTLYGTYEYAENSGSSAPGNLYANSFVPQTLSVLLDDSLSSSDDLTQKTVVRRFSDVLLIQDWLSIRLQKPSIWTTPQLGLPSSTGGVLYGRVTYGSVVYGSLPRTFWASEPVTTPSVNGWRNYNQLETQP